MSLLWERLESKSLRVLVSKADCRALIFLRTYPAVPLFLFALTLLRHHSAFRFTNLPCCAIKYFSSHSCCALKFFFRTYPAVLLSRFTIPLNLLSHKIFFRTYPAVLFSRFTITTYPAVALFFFSHLPCRALFPLFVYQLTANYQNRPAAYV